MCVFPHNAIMGWVSGTEAAVDNTQASWSCGRLLAELQEDGFVP